MYEDYSDVKELTGSAIVEPVYLGVFLFLRHVINEPYPARDHTRLLVCEDG